MQEDEDSPAIDVAEGGNGHAVAIRHLERDIEGVKQELARLHAWRETSARYWGIALIVLAGTLFVGGAFLHSAIRAAVDRAIAPPVPVPQSISVSWLERRIEAIRRELRAFPADPAAYTATGAPRVAELERRLPYLGQIQPWERDAAWFLEQRAGPAP